jgi:hypothetical protein
VELPELAAIRGSETQNEELERFIEDWHNGEGPHQFARQMGTFLFRFLDHLTRLGLSERAVSKHEANCWLIGKFTSDWGGFETFSPEVFLSSPRYLAEFQRQVGSTPSALASYKATLCKLEQYVRAEI